MPKPAGPPLTHTAPTSQSDPGDAMPTPAHVVAWGRHRIRLLPGWRATFRHNRHATSDAAVTDRRRDGRGPAELVHVHQPPDSGTRLRDADGPGTVSTRFDIYRDHGIDTADDAAMHVAAAVLATTFHETLEWVTIDGTHLADPHPPDNEQWDWTLDRMIDLLDDYRSRWPPRHTHKGTP